MVARALGWLSVVTALSCVGGCGKSQGGGEQIPQSELPSRIASLQCESLAGCCQSSGFAFDTAACKAAVTADFQEEIGEELQRRVVYDAQAAGDCLAAVGPQVMCGELEDVSAPACERIFRGTIPLGQACNSDNECVPVAGQRATCYSADGVAAEVCTDLSTTNARHGQAGEACFSTCSEGGECGAVVGPAPGPGVPVPAMEPATCYRDDGLYCSALDGCSPLLDVGETCMDYDSCRGDAFCDFTTGVCTAPRADGEECTGDSECQSGSCPGAYDVNDVDGRGVCVARVDVTAEQCANDFMDAPPQPQPLPPEPAPGTP